MPGVLEPNLWHWIVFIACVLVFLALDLGVFHRTAHVVRFREALGWTAVWASLALLFGLGLAPQVIGGWTHRETVEFVTGYIVELSLSMDNVFVIAMLFTYFRVPAQYQHRVLFWGILGALVMRGLMILGGAALVSRFQWTLYLFGLFLVATAIKMLLVEDEGVAPERNPLLRLARKFFPVSAEFHGQRFTTHLAGRRALTPLALVLVLVESTDLIFALDSIPAIFAITTEPFIVFTSNVFAILGLRSLYFVLAGAIAYFRYLKVGLALVLAFVGVKMLLDPHDAPRWGWQTEISPGLSLAVVGAILLLAVACSLVAAWRQKRPNRTR
jgi:tellurite resistance protein TerC